MKRARAIAQHLSIPLQLASSPPGQSLLGQSFTSAAACSSGDGVEADGVCVRPTPCPSMQRILTSTALSAVGGALPVNARELAQRAYLYTLDPLRNPVKEVQDAFPSVREMPPLLGIFNDIPAHKMREDEVLSWAKAGFSFVVSDGEHSSLFGRMGREQHAMIGRVGMLSVQRLHREAISEHGDAYQLGARATMRPYGTTVAEAQQYLKAVSFPSGTAGEATPHDRGGYPVRLGDRSMCFTPNSLRAAETETQAWVQFETGEYIQDAVIRGGVLDAMAGQGPGKAVGFVGPFDAVIRNGPSTSMEQGIQQLVAAAAERGIPLGRVCGSGLVKDPKDIEEAMYGAVKQGVRLVCVHMMTSDLPLLGAQKVAQPFFKACARAGF